MRGFIYLAHVLFFCRCLIKFIVRFKTVCVSIKNNKHEITDQYPQVVPQVRNDHTIIQAMDPTDGLSSFYPWFILICTCNSPNMDCANYTKYKHTLVSSRILTEYKDTVISSRILTEYKDTVISSWILTEYKDTVISSWSFTSRQLHRVTSGRIKHSYFYINFF